MSDDRHFERLVRGAARRGRQTPACPDPALLAAYVDGSLGRRERAELERHAADCLRCTEHLALLAALEGPAGATRAGARRPTFWQGWRWLVPLATAVVVFAVWQRTDLPRQPEPVRQEFGAPAPADEPERRAPAADDTARERDAGGADDGDAVVGQTGTDALMRRKPSGQAMPEAPEAKDERALADAAPEAPQTTFRGQGGRAAAPPAVADTRAGERFEAEAAREGAATTMSLESKAANAPPVVAAGPGVLMRITARGVERSADGGATWTLDLVNPPAALRVLTCPSEVCWAGGDEGLLLRRERSGTWTPRELPTRSPLTGIDATGDAAAVVTTEDGDRFRTSDGGTTWTRVTR